MKNKGHRVSEKRRKLHHFVPETLLRRFCWCDNTIWFSERDESGAFKPIESRNPKSTFKKRDYYTVLGDGDELSDAVEREFYGQIDDYLGKFLKEMEAIFALEKVPSFGAKAERDLKKVISHMIRRGPDFVKSYNEVEIGREVTEQTIEALQNRREQGAEIELLATRLNETTELRNVGRHVRVNAQAAESKRIDKALNDFSIRWVRLTGKHSFIISSLCAYRIGNGGSNGLSNPNAEIWFPINPKTALVLVNDPTDKIPIVNSFDRDALRKMNEYAVRESSQVASHSRSLLSSLLFG